VRIDENRNSKIKTREGRNSKFETRKSKLGEFRFSNFDFQLDQRRMKMKKGIGNRLQGTVLLFAFLCSSLITRHSSLLLAQGTSPAGTYSQAAALPHFNGVLAPAAPTAEAVVGQYNYAGVLLPSTLPTGVYNVYLTYVDAAGNESKVGSTTAVTTTAADPAIQVLGPGYPSVGQPAGYNVYICAQSSGTCTSETLQNSAPLLPGQTYFQSAPLAAVTSPPSANTKFPYTAGTVYYGGTATAIAAGTLTLSGGALSNCAAPGYSSCGFGYFNGTGLAYTTSLSTATAAGDFPLWAITLDSSSTALTVTPFSLMAPASVPPSPSTKPVEVYTTAATAGHASISATTMVTPSVQTTYRFSSYLTETVVGSGGTCATGTTVVVNLVYQDPNAASAQTVALGTWTVTGAGTIGYVPWTSGPTTYTFTSVASAAVQFSTTYTNGNCTTAPTVQIFPVLEQF
jgi:hypothetical protein